MEYPVEQLEAQLADLDERPVVEHLAVFEGVHEQLRATLDEA